MHFLFLAVVAGVELVLEYLDGGVVLRDGLEVGDGLVVGVVVGRAEVGSGADRLEVVLVAPAQVLAQLPALDALEGRPQLQEEALFEQQDQLEAQ